MGLLEQITVVPRSGVTWDDDPLAWYFEMPAIAQLRTEGLRLDSAVTVVVGENGSGKSTLVEAVATAWHHSLTGAQAQHGLAGAGQEDADLHRHLEFTGQRPRPHGGCFLRAETMHATFSSADAAGVRDYGGTLNTRSHGESFLGHFSGRPVEIGLWVLDEPEAALSFQSCLALLALLALLRDLASEGSRYCSPPTPPCSPPVLARSSSNRAGTVFAASDGTSWKWCRAGRRFLRHPSGSFGTSDRSRA